MAGYYKRRPAYMKKKKPTTKKRIGYRKSKLKLNYRSINTYTFMRETLPSTATFSLITGGPSFATIGYMNFDNLQFNQLPGVNDFSNLFGRYKVSKIVSCLVPLWNEVASSLSVNPSISPQLEITKVNTKWMNGPFPLAANADLQLDELAQLQSKSKMLYNQKRCLYLVTHNPGVVGNSVVNASGTEVDTRRSSPWLALSGPNVATNVPFKHNSLIFGARVDGLALDAQWKYRVTHKVYFQCSQVG